ncbi:MAG: C1 family peptidase [Patescibacteria group bacterium]
MTKKVIILAVVGVFCLFYSADSARAPYKQDSPQLCTQSSEVLGIDQSDPTPKIGSANPAAVYCTELGYKHDIITEADSSQHADCVFPDNSRCDEWSFYYGQCGQTHSYCAQNGYDIITKQANDNPYSQKYTVCTENGREIGAVADLMNLEDKIVGASYKPTAEEILASKDSGSGSNRVLPDSFNWQDFLGQNFMTPVKDQQTCPLCWAFSAIGTTEGMYDIRNGADYNLDMSEQQIASSGGVGYCAGYGCVPGGSTNALNYIRDYGLVSETCFPYTNSGSTPCNLCSGWESELKYITDKNIDIPSDTESIKEYIFNHGPVSVNMAFDFGTIQWGDYDGNNIYRCDEGDPGYDINHAVVISGYNEIEDYWVVKNSYGTYWGQGNGDGYFNVGYGECNIQGSPTGVELDHECGGFVYTQADATLNKDLIGCSNGLSIMADDIAFDCQGHKISGTGSGVGINLNGRTNVTINNCVIEGFDTGINLVNSENNQFFGNIFMNNNFNASEDASSNNNNWNDVDTGNYWDDYEINPGLPWGYEITGPGDGMDYKFYLTEDNVTTFNNGLPSEQLTFTGEDITRYIELPKDNLAIGGDFEVTGIVSYTANDDEFQDDWDSAGEFYLPATYGPEKAVDGDYGTKSICVYDTYCDIFEYYDRDPSITSATWTFKYQLYSGAGGAKVECWNYDTSAYEQFYYSSQTNIQTKSAAVPAACLSGPQLKVRTPMNGLGGGGFRLFESKVTWDEPMYPTNPEIEVGTDDNNPEWSYSGVFDQSNVAIGDFSYALYQALNHGACDCTGCTLNDDTCSIPVKFHSATGGILEYSNIGVSHASPFLDTDSDGVADVNDNCQATYNPGQEDFDEDGIGDVCDNCQNDYNPGQEDGDGDLIGNVCDNCPINYNPGQEDGDGDLVGDVCDNCEFINNPGQEDDDSDGIGNVCDNCVEDYNPTQLNSDADVWGDACDNCHLVYNPAQGDIDTDTVGDACDYEDYEYIRHFSAEYLDTGNVSYDNVMGGGPCNQPGGCEYTDQTTSVAFCNGPSYPNYCSYQGTCYEGNGSVILDIDGDDRHEAICVGKGWWDLDSGTELGYGYTPLPGIEVCEMGGYQWLPGETTAVGEYLWSYNNFGCCGDDEGEYIDGITCKSSIRKSIPVKQPIIGLFR